MRKLTVVLCLALSSCTARSVDTQGNVSADPEFIGAWHSDVQFDSGALAAFKDLKFLYVFNAGGTLTESSNYDEAPPVPPAYGLWRPAGPRQFEAIYAFFITKPPVRLDDVLGGSGGWLPAGRGVLRERMTLANDGQSFESTLMLEIYDQGGKLASGGGTGKGQGVRMKF